MDDFFRSESRSSPNWHCSHLCLISNTYLDTIHLKRLQNVLSGASRIKACQEVRPLQLILKPCLEPLMGSQLTNTMTQSGAAISGSALTTLVHTVANRGYYGLKSSMTPEINLNCD